MTEHPTSHEARQAASAAPAPGPANQSPAPAEDTNLAVPDPRTALQRAADTTGEQPEPASGRRRPPARRSAPDPGATGPGAAAAPPRESRAPERGSDRTPERAPDRAPDRNAAEAARRAAARGAGAPGSERARTAAPGAVGHHRDDPTPRPRPEHAAQPEPADAPQPKPGTPEATRPSARSSGPSGTRGGGRGTARGPVGRSTPASGIPAGQQPQPGRPPERALPPEDPDQPVRPGYPGGTIGSTGLQTTRTAGGDRLRFIGAATRRIARGIDLDEIVLGLCRATVPTFSDAILVYLRDPLPVGDERPTGPVSLRLRRTDRLPDLSSGLQDSDTGGIRLPLIPPHPDLGISVSGAAAEVCEVRPGGPLAEVLRGVRPVFADSAAAQAALPELLGENRAVPTGYRVILAPLRGRRRVIGAAVFLRRSDRPAFDPDDLLVAAQLATHTALGIDKAVLYGREAYIADELQRTMLPDSLPQPTGVRLASRYLPAAETARVGGDWYDAIPLPGSRVALVVGDVMGHSMTSAAIMGQLRTTAQTLAGLDLPPEEVLHHLDEQAQRLGSDRMATCLYAVYDPVAHRIVIANAGHPPPVMLHRGGRAEVLHIPPGAPIGVGGVDFEAVELDAPEGATLILYTDGLVESRVRDVWTGIEQLREKVAETARLTGPNPPPLEPLCDEVLDILGPGDRDDDIALLAARFDGIAPSDVAYWYLDPKAQTAGQARRLARRALARWDLEELTDSLELLVSEVVTNAVRYAERPITLRLLRTDVLRCEVGDDVPQLPRLRQASLSDEGGRGLYLVNRLARRWGATRLSTGKVVWFELGLPIEQQ
ncbi:SpoIIE family protein phosphatase [Streptomyces sp. H27-D2]|uniref:SpoIIE family protein phosphatase n=1 Tax=Streptomyces sp. H27-D2 TaxID=3046304 RepID=UPI002DBCF06B|nr:SpoIIE family protein phosphatase [Streptomyces sp. H27-D2]MEC4016531.1 SpoIIE family protein phosphatase [Streptomyces sp. H27-D2]